jgi:hypothetical protein
MKFTRLEMIVITIEATIAVKKESISNPGTSLEAIIRRMALMTNMKSPRVSIVAGSVRSKRIGLTNILRTAKTSATAKALV